MGAIDCAAVETIIRQQQISEPLTNRENLQSLIPIREMDWEFDLSPYAELCEEAAL